MKVLISSYNIVCQNASGGVQVRIKNFMKYISKLAEVKLFDIWTDKLADFDILHIFKANIDSYALMVNAKQKGKKIVLSSVIPQEKKFVTKVNLLFGKIFRLQTGYTILKKELELADSILAQTEQEKAFIEKQYGIQKEKITVIPNGISVDFDEKNRNALESKYPIHEKYLLQVGRFDENKNQLSVIKALKGTGVKVLFVGGPDPQSASYYEQCKKEADDNFTFIGWLKNNSPELQSAYMNAHAMILPSQKEIFGNSLIEAGASGAKLIATKSLPLESMGISDYCKGIDPNNIEDIRAKVLEAMEEEKKEDQITHFRSLFSWETVANMHMEIYKKVLGYAQKN